MTDRERDDSESETESVDSEGEMPEKRRKEEGDGGEAKSKSKSKPKPKPKPKTSKSGGSDDDEDGRKRKGNDDGKDDGGGDEKKRDDADDGAASGDDDDKPSTPSAEELEETSDRVAQIVAARSTILETFGFASLTGMRCAMRFSKAGVLSIGYDKNKFCVMRMMSNPGRFSKYAYGSSLDSVDVTAPVGAILRCDGVKGRRNKTADARPVTVDFRESRETKLTWAIVRVDGMEAPAKVIPCGEADIDDLPFADGKAPAAKVRIGAGVVLEAIAKASESDAKTVEVAIDETGVRFERKKRSGHTHRTRLEHASVDCSAGTARGEYTVEVLRKATTRALRGAGEIGIGILTNGGGSMPLIVDLGTHNYDAIVAIAPIEDGSSSK